MVEYRIFPMNDAGGIAAASTVILCADDEQAIAEANALSLGSKVEVWQGSRKVAILPMTV